MRYLGGLGRWRNGRTPDANVDESRTTATAADRFVRAQRILEWIDWQKNHPQAAMRLYRDGSGALIINTAWWLKNQEAVQQISKVIGSNRWSHMNDQTELHFCFLRMDGEMT